MAVSKHIEFSEIVQVGFGSNRLKNDLQIMFWSNRSNICCVFGYVE